MTFINILGTNGIGKSTRVTTLVKYLDNNYSCEMVYEEIKNSSKEVGRIYSCEDNGKTKKYFILGRFNKKETWVGLDNADFPTHEKRMDFMHSIKNRYNVDFYIQEGFFNNGSKRNTLEFLSTKGVSSYINYFLIYDDIQQFIERTNTRTGKNRGLDWAEKSPGWRQNASSDKLYDFYIELDDKGCKNVKLNLDAPRDYLVQELFNDTYVLNAKEDAQEDVTDNVIEDW